MRRLLALLALCAPGLSAPAASANDSPACRDLWFTRNQTMDRAGHCFGSPLGQAVFDNSDCTGKQVALKPAAAELVAEIRALEERIGCKVNTQAVALDLPDIDIRRRLDDLPVLDELPGLCIGWLGAPAPLRAGQDPASATIGRIEPGDVVAFDHLGTDSATYVTVYEDRSGPLKSGGWLSERANCREMIP